MEFWAVLYTSIQQCVASCTKIFSWPSGYTPNYVNLNGTEHSIMMIIIMSYTKLIKLIIFSLLCKVVMYTTSALMITITYHLCSVLLLSSL